MFINISRPTFIEGMARCMDIGGCLQEYNWQESSDKHDFYALQSDVEAVAGDFYTIYEQEKRGGTNRAREME